MRSPRSAVITDVFRRLPGRANVKGRRSPKGVRSEPAAACRSSAASPGSRYSIGSRPWPTSALSLFIGGSVQVRIHEYAFDPLLSLGEGLGTTSGEQLGSFIKGAVRGIGPSLLQQGAAQRLPAERVIGKHQRHLPRYCFRLGVLS